LLQFSSASHQLKHTDVFIFQPCLAVLLTDDSQYPPLNQKPGPGLL